MLCSRKAGYMDILALTSSLHLSVFTSLVNSNWTNFVPYSLEINLGRKYDTKRNISLEDQ